jgi:2-aminoethylphosphonate-pyruvate transaminase
MLRDWGSRDATFLDINEATLGQLVEIVNGGAAYVAVPMQGSGTFAVEAMLTTFIPKTGKVLILTNGGFGRRAARISEIARHHVLVHQTPENVSPDLTAVEQILIREPAITHIFAVHCETSSGILNPIENLALLAASYRKNLLIDAISTYGGIKLDAPTLKFDALAASPNKCLEGVPGLSFVICRKGALDATKGNATTLVLDLYDQWQHFVETGQYRFTPPTHVVVALHQALEEFTAEGGVGSRGRRYQENSRVLVESMRALGFETFLPDHLRAPIVVTFLTPDDPHFAFEEFYQKLKARGYIIYQGKLSHAKSFQIACMGRLNAQEMHRAASAIRNTLSEMGVQLKTPDRVRVSALN